MDKVFTAIIFGIFFIGVFMVVSTQKAHAGEQRHGYFCAKTSAMAYRIASARDAGVSEAKIIDIARNSTEGESPAVRHAMIGMAKTIYAIDLAPEEVRKTILTQCLAAK